MRHIPSASLVFASTLVVAACSSQPAAPPESAAPAPAPTTETSAPVTDQQTPATAAQAPAPAARPQASVPGTPGAQPGAATTSAAPGAPTPVTQSPAAAEPAAPPAPPAPEYREVTIPAGTRLSVVLDTTVASDKSQVEDRVLAYLDQPVVIDEMTVVPRNAKVFGTVTEATRSGKVKGLARIVVRFRQMSVSDGETLDIKTASVVREAQSTKKKDATKVGIGAVGGAIIGGIAGGGKGAAIGTAVGGGVGTGAVMMTRGDEVELAAGTPLKVQLTAPLTVSVRVR